MCETSARRSDPRRMCGINYPKPSLQRRLRRWSDRFRIAIRRQIPISIRSGSAQIAGAKNIAAAKSVGYQTQLRMWIAEGIKREAKRAWLRYRDQSQSLPAHWFPWAAFHGRNPQCAPQSWSHACASSASSAQNLSASDSVIFRSLPRRKDRNTDELRQASLQSIEALGQSGLRRADWIAITLLAAAPQMP